MVGEQLAIRLRGVVKRYGPITAVNGLDLDVCQGTCVGLLGRTAPASRPRCDCSPHRPLPTRVSWRCSASGPGGVEAGACRVRSLATARQPRRDADGRAEPGCVREPVQDRRGERRAAIERALEIANLVERRDSRVDKLSGGMRRRMLIARALVHRPRLPLLDEPTVGLDPQVRQELWALIDALHAQGTTILMSTQYIEEAQRLADTVLIMSHGRAVATGPPVELVAKHAGREVVEVYGPPSRLAEVEALAQAAGIRTRRTGTSVSVLGVDGSDGRAPEGERRPANLEDVFVLLTGEEID